MKVFVSFCTLFVIPALPAGARFADQKSEYAQITKSFIAPEFLYQTAVSNGMLLFLVMTTVIVFFLALAFSVSAISFRRENNKKAERWNRLETQWEPLILSVMEGEGRPEAVWEHVEKKDRLYFIDFLMRFARRFRGEELQVLSDLARPFLGEVAGHLKSHPPAQRARAIQALGFLGFRHYVNDIVAALNDTSPLVAMVAARVLAQREHPQYVSQVVDALHRFDDWSPKFLAAMLSAVGPEAAPVLREAYADSSRPLNIRAVSAEALRELNDFPAADLAAKVLGEEREPESAVHREGAPKEAEMAAPRPEMPAVAVDEERLEEGPISDQPNPHRDLIASSLRLVRSMGRPAHAEMVRPLCSSVDFVVRAFACRALGKIGSRSDIARLEAALMDASIWVALHAARALRELGADDTLREIAAQKHPRMGVASQVLAEAIR